MSATIYFCGDIHGRLDHIDQALDSCGGKPPAALILLGDQEVGPLGAAQFEKWIRETEARGVCVRWIIGNHDTDSESNYRALTDSAFIRERDIGRRVVEIAGLRVAGLGGIFRGSIWRQSPCDATDEHPANFDNYDDLVRHLHQKRNIAQRLQKLERSRADAIPDRVAVLMDPIRDGQLRQHKSTIFPDDVRRLAAQQADLLVTHEGPGQHPYGFQVIDDLAGQMGCRLHFHGHLHDNLPYAPMASGCRPHGVGLCGISALHLNSFTVEIIMPGLEDAKNLSKFLRYQTEAP